MIAFYFVIIFVIVVRSTRSSETTNRIDDIKNEILKILSEILLLGNGNEQETSTTTVKENYIPIPLIQAKLSNEKVKKLLDDYTLVKKETYVPIPEKLYFFQNNVENEKYKTNTVFNAVKNSVAALSNLPTKIDIEIEKHPSAVINNKYLEVKDQSNKDEKLRMSITKNQVQHVDLLQEPTNKTTTIPLNNKDNILKNEPKPLDIKHEDGKLTKNAPNAVFIKALKTETDRMNQLLEEFKNLALLRNERQAEFDDIEQKAVERRNIEDQTSTTPTLPTTLKTVEMVIDESLVKEALKRDPLIQRILKLSNLKKELAEQI